jgi:hypothetical protein
LETTKAVDVLENNFFSPQKFDWKEQLHIICTDGTPATLGNTSTFATLLVEKEDHRVVITHCYLQRHATPSVSGL